MSDILLWCALLLTGIGVGAAIQDLVQKKKAPNPVPAKLAYEHRDTCLSEVLAELGQMYLAHGDIYVKRHHYQESADSVEPMLDNLIELQFEYTSVDNR